MIVFQESQVEVRFAIEISIDAQKSVKIDQLMIMFVFVVV